MSMEQTMERRNTCTVCQEMIDGTGQGWWFRHCGIDLITAENAASIRLCPCCHQTMPDRYFTDKRCFRGLKRRWEYLCIGQPTKADPPHEDAPE